MKKIALTGILFGMTLSTLSVFADTDVVIPSVPSVSSVAHVEEKNEGFNDRSFRNIPATTTLIRLRAQGDRLIKERLNSLTSNKEVIVGNKTLTDAQKTVITSRIDTNISGLTVLQTQIAQSTDASTTKSLIGSMYTNFRIYGIVIPQVRLEKRINDLQNHAAKLTGTFSQVQVKIDEAKAKGKDVTVWQKSLDDAKSLVAKDVATLDSLFVKADALTPVDYGTTSKAIIESINKSLKTVLQDFNTIKKNLHRPEVMRTVSKKVVGNGSVTPSGLFGTSWTWVTATENGITTVPKSDAFVISFGEDNRVSSKTDCNTLTGSYKLNGTTFSFSPLAMTMMYCDGSQESVYSGLLSKVTSYAVNGSQLTLSLSTGGSMVFSKK